MIQGITVTPSTKPRTQPTKAALPEYHRYFRMITRPEKPMAFRVPIWVRSSLIIRVMVVTQTSAAMSTKNTGKAPATAVTMLVSFSKVT